MEFAALGEAHWSPCNVSRPCLRSRAIFCFTQAVCHYLSPQDDVAADGAAQCPKCVIKEETALFLGFSLFQPQSFD